MSQPDWDAVRAEFPALSGIAYLNTATYGQTPRAATDAVRQHFERRDSRACSDFLTWFDDMDAIRGAVARLLNAPSADDIALCGSASTAMAWLFNGVQWQRGDRIVGLTDEFPNNLYFPAAMQREGVEFIETDWEGIHRELEHSRVRLVLLSTVNYASGFRPELDGLAERVHKAGGVLLLDATQSVGALRLDVQHLQADMVVVDAYKWMLSPNGAGFAYIRPSLRRQMDPSVIGWRSDRGWRGVDALHHGAPEFVDAAERYEGGMLDFPSLYAMGAVVDLMLQLGPEAIHARVMELAGRCEALLQESGGEVAHPGSQILAARFPDTDHSRLSNQLREAGVHVSARHGRLRVSVHFYNNDEDLAQLRKQLHNALASSRV